MITKKPITPRPNITDDDTIDRGVSGQSLRDTGMHYDPATGKSTGGATDVNLVHNPHSGMEKPSGY